VPDPVPPRLLARASFVVATAFGAGLSPIAPGTAGSLVGLLLFWPAARLVLGAQAALVAAVSLLGVSCASAVARRLGRKDPGEVVVDEVAGQWVALLALPFSPLTAAVAFLAFRIMDVTKPWPARSLEALPGGWGIMADDLAAGVYANLLARLVLRALDAS
jgi:phosphatidylglycerophosphatase A